MNEASHATTSNVNRWWIVVTIMLVAILEVLDSTIVNVSLPAMMPSLGANQEQITWVLTSYVVASAIVLPLTGFLINRIGIKQLLLIDIIGFMISSFICGTSQSLEMMVVFRLLQGAFGSTMIPISQAVLRQTFPADEQGKAMAIWGLGIMVAPVMGPTLGGFITEHSSWRWVFYINLPVCIIGTLLVLAFIKKTKPIKQKIDYLGVLLMFIGIGSLQVFLDQGNGKDWFGSHLILSLFFTFIFCLVTFIIRTYRHKHPVINLYIFKDRNFTVSTLALAIYAGAVFGTVTLEPIMLETLYGYSALTAGITMAPLGLSSAIAMMLVSILMKHINIKYITSFALLSAACGMFYLTRMDLASAQVNFFIANTFIGIGMGCFMVPISTYSLISLAPKDVPEGSGLFSYGRMLGSSIGISVLSTLVTRLSQINWNRIGGQINPFNNNLILWLQHQHLNITDPKAVSQLTMIVHTQSSMIAFIDCYYVLAFVLITLIPLMLMLKHVDMSNTDVSAH